MIIKHWKKTFKDGFSKGYLIYFFIVVFLTLVIGLSIFLTLIYNKETKSFEIVKKDLNSTLADTFLGVGATYITGGLVPILITYGFGTSYLKHRTSRKIQILKVRIMEEKNKGNSLEQKIKIQNMEKNLKTLEQKNKLDHKIYRLSFYTLVGIGCFFVLLTLIFTYI